MPSRPLRAALQGTWLGSKSASGHCTSWGSRKQTVASRTVLLLTTTGASSGTQMRDAVACGCFFYFDIDKPIVR